MLGALLRMLLGRSGGGMLARLLGGPMLGIIIGLLRKSGGLNGMLDKFKGAGLGDKADSWVGTGPNQGLSGDEVQQALGPEEIQQIAQQTGLSEDEVRAKLAQGLPEVVNHLTPKGEVPDQAALDGKLAKLGRFTPK